MFKFWGKLVKDGRAIKSETIQMPLADTRTHKVFDSIDALCKIWDLGRPIWLDANIDEFKRHGKTRFSRDSFIEEIEFDFMEVQITEED